MAETLIDNNKKIEEDISKLKDTLRSLRFATQTVEVNTASSDDVEEVDTKILREKCKLMQAQINNLIEKPLQTIPDDIDLQYFMLKNDMLKRIYQNTEYSAYLDVKRKEAIESLEREECVNKELQLVIEAIQRKLQETVQEKHTKAEVQKRLEVKCMAVDKTNTQKWRDMAAFIDEQYPLPDEMCFRKVKDKNMGEAQLTTLKDLLPLKTIVKKLMTACIDTPNDPYIEIDHRFWPPYVELLLQCDIALRHPELVGRIKLMPFHL